MSQNFGPAAPAKRPPANGAGDSPRDGEETPPRRGPVPIEEIEEAIRSIRYGTVQIIIQDGFVIQIDKTEKVRLR